MFRSYGSIFASVYYTLLSFIIMNIYNYNI